MDRDVVICKSLDDIAEMFDNQNIMKGIKPVSLQREEILKAKEAQDHNDDNVKIFRIPVEHFDDFTIINENNEDMFEFLAFQLVIAYLEKRCLQIDENEMKEPIWDTAVEFPDCIASMGRSKLHEVANYFGLAHHSTGPKNRRKTLLYPKTLFIEKQ